MLVDVMIRIILPLWEYHFLFRRLFWSSMSVLYLKVIIFPFPQLLHPSFFFFR